MTSGDKLVEVACCWLLEYQTTRINGSGVPPKANKAVINENRYATQVEAYCSAVLFSGHYFTIFDLIIRNSNGAVVAALFESPY